MSSPPQHQRSASRGMPSVSAPSRRESLDSVFMKPDGPLPPLVDFSALGRKDADVFNTGHYMNALLATGLFRIWPSLLFVAAWTVMIYAVNRYTKAELLFPPTLLTVFGTVLGFVVAYRSSSAMERWAEGRKMWSNITLASRTWARCVWIACPDSMVKVPPTDPAARKLDMVRAIVEKKSVINLVEAFGVAMKHYLRGEAGIFYEDLYPLVKHLPGYNLPAALPSPNEPRGPNPFSEQSERALDQVPYISPRRSLDGIVMSRLHTQDGSDSTKIDVSLGTAGDTLLAQIPILSLSGASGPTPTADDSAPPRARPVVHLDTSNLDPPIPSTPLLSRSHTETPVLKPARNPPPSVRMSERWPFRLMVSAKTKERLRSEEGARARREQMEMARRGTVSENLPFELTIYLSSYIAALTRRDSIDVPTKNTLIGAVTMLSDSLTSLERILTTPIPFSYSAHIWTVCWCYVLLVPFQIIQNFGWVTIPVSVLIAFIFLVFLAIGEEIENPFGFDKNDLNLDQFNHLIRAELAAITSRPAPDPEEWVFVHENDTLFGSSESSYSAVQIQTQGLRALRTALAAQGGDSGGSMGEDERFGKRERGFMSPVVGRVPTPRRRGTGAGKEQ